MKKEISEAINAMRMASSRQYVLTESDKDALLKASNELAALNAELIQNDDLVATLAVTTERRDEFAEDAAVAGNLLERWLLVATNDMTTMSGEHRVASVPQSLINETDEFLDGNDVDSPAGLGGTIVDLDDFGDDGGTPLSDIRPEDFGEPAGPDYTGS